MVSAPDSPFFVFESPVHAFQGIGNGKRKKAILHSSPGIHDVFVPQRLLQEWTPKIRLGDILSVNAKRAVGHVADFFNYQVLKILKVVPAPSDSFPISPLSQSHPITVRVEPPLSLQSGSVCMPPVSLSENAPTSAARPLSSTGVVTMLPMTSGPVVSCPPFPPKPQPPFQAWRDQAQGRSTQIQKLPPTESSPQITLGKVIRVCSNGNIFIESRVGLADILVPAHIWNGRTTCVQVRNSKPQTVDRRP